EASVDAAWRSRVKYPTELIHRAFSGSPGHTAPSERVTQANGACLQRVRRGAEKRVQKRWWFAFRDKARRKPTQRGANFAINRIFKEGNPIRPPQAQACLERRSTEAEYPFCLVPPHGSNAHHVRGELVFGPELRLTLPGVCEEGHHLTT